MHQPNSFAIHRRSSMGVGPAAMFNRIQSLGKVEEAKGENEEDWASSRPGTAQAGNRDGPKSNSGSDSGSPVSPPSRYDEETTMLM
jgi:hypothetical protein